MIKHYDGVLGTFDYDDEMFEVVEDLDGAEYFGAPEYLHYTGNGSSIELPDGCVNTNRMFYDCQLPKDLNLGEKFDTSKVENMHGMFGYCKLSEGFSLGEKFDTSNVTDMEDMFCYCKLPEDFSLGEKFNTSSVTCIVQLYCEVG